MGRWYRSSPGPPVPGASLRASLPVDWTGVLRSRTICLLAVLAALLAGCRLDVRAEVEVARDGSGTAALVVTLDPALLDELDELAVDPTAELTAAAARDREWELERRTSDAGGLELTLHRRAADPATLTDALRELAAGLSEDDPALLVDLELTVDEEGAADLAGTLELRPPSGPGVLLDDAASAELADLVAQTVDATLVVTLPGAVTEADADHADGSTLTWKVAPGEPRPVNARAAAPTGWPVETVVAVLAGLLVLASAVVVTVVLRRRRAGDQQRT
jgi:hypothetical protein